MLVEHVLEPVLYAHMRMFVVNAMDGLYSKRLYEIIKDAKCRLSLNGAKSYVTDYFCVSDLKKLLGLSDRNIEFKYLKKDIIKPALKEISKKSDCIVELQDLQKEGRTIVGVSFCISEKEEVQALPLFDAIADGKRKFLERIGTLGVSVPRSLLDAHDSEILLSALDYTEAQVVLGKVRNVGAYLAEAIKADYGRSLRDQAAMEDLKQRKAALRERVIRFEAEAQRDCVAAVNAYLMQLSDDYKHGLCREFLASDDGKRYVGVNRLYAEARGVPSFFPVFLTSVGDKEQSIAGSIAFASFCRGRLPAGAVVPSDLIGE